MRILLCEDVEKLGWLGDVVDVSSGYARNYLLPQKLGMVPTESNLRSLAEEKAERAEQRIRDGKRLADAAKAVEGAEAVVAAKANELGHLFGSVGPSQIAANLREQGFEVADEVVQLAENIKQVGTSQVTLKFASVFGGTTNDEDDLTATVSVVVVAEGDLKGTEGDDESVRPPQEPEQKDENESTDQSR